MKILASIMVAVSAAAAFAILAWGYRAADAMFIQPAVTKRIAQQAIDAVEPGWYVTEATYGRETFHRYIYRKDGQRRDVNCTRDADGTWSAGVTPIFGAPLP